MSISSFDAIQRVHIIGVCGTLMGAFAAFLRRKGIDVSGSDQNIYPPMSDVLERAGVRLFKNYSADNLCQNGGSRPDLVVIGNVIRSDNPEARAAIDGGYQHCSLPEAMEQLLLKETCNIVVAGTHGKTTTSSLLAHVLTVARSDPNYFIGGVPIDLPYSFHVSGTGKGRPFVLEGDEYDTAFWDKVPKFNHYLPDHVIITSIEFDHADIYRDLASVEQAFSGLITRVRKRGHIIACADDRSVVEVVKLALVPILTYGSASSAAARYIPGRIKIDGRSMTFEIIDRESGPSAIDELTIGLPGRHNMMNAIAAWIECKMLDLDPQKVRDGFLSFSGVKRRQEVRDIVGGITIIDDFAHHPSAVRETLLGLKAAYPKHRLVAVFEPRSATSRRKVFQNDYKMAFSAAADAVFVSAPYDQSRIPAEDQFSSQQLVNDLTNAGRYSELFSSVEDGVSVLAKFCRSGDLLVVLSNGGFGGLIPKIIEKLGVLS